MTQTLPYNFGALSPELSAWDRSKVAVLPIPYDGTSAYPGSRHGPSAIISASRHLELFDEELLVDVGSTLGICTLEELEPDMRGPEPTVERCLEAARAVVQSGKFLFTLGGETTSTLGSIKAVSEQFPRATILHLGAHLGLRSQYQGTDHHRHCAMHRVHARMGLHLVQVGARSFSEDEYRYAESRNIHPFFARDVVGRYEFVERLIRELHDEVYVCVDLSVFDPSVMPATSWPEPGGLDWYLTIHTLRKVAEKKRIVGADVHELMPSVGGFGSALLAAKLAYKIMGYTFLLK